MTLRFVLAHGSGIDDVLWFVVPVLAALGLLRLAERRARRKADDTGGVSSPEPGAREDVESP